MSQKGIGHVTVEEISKATKIELDDVIALLNNHYRSPVSFDESPTYGRNGHNEDSSHTLMDHICDDENFFESWIENELMEVCSRLEMTETMRRAVIEEAEKIQREAVKKGSKMDAVGVAIDRYGLNGTAVPMAQINVANKYNIGRKPMQRFEAKLLKAIKERVDVKQLAAEIGL